MKLAHLSFGLSSKIDTLTLEPLPKWLAEVQVQRYSLTARYLNQEIASCRSTSTEQPREKSPLARAGGMLTDESHFFQLLQEIGNIPEELRTRQAKLSLENIRYLIRGAPIFYHLPDPGSNRVQAEAKTLLDIE